MKKEDIDKLVANVDPNAKLPRHFDLWSRGMAIAWLQSHQRKELAEVEGSGWPCHSFIRQPIYRKITLSRDVRITDKGITLRLTPPQGKTEFISLTWKEIAERYPLFPRRRRKDHGTKADARKKV